MATSAKAAGRPARATPHAIVSNEDPMMVFQTEKLQIDRTHNFRTKNG